MINTTCPICHKPLGVYGFTYRTVNDQLERVHTRCAVPAKPNPFEKKPSWEDIDSLPGPKR